MIVIMFICNIKMNRNWLKKIIVTFIVLLIIIVFMIVGYRFYESTSRVMVTDDFSTSEGNNFIEVNSNNYTNILKDCHENIDKYVGKKIKFTGFVYRLYDFDENQFVLAREMIISSDNQAVVVGFLCKNVANDVDMQAFKVRSWVEIEGVIVKGEYHGERPVIEVNCIKETSVPNDEFVYPPDGSFVSTGD